MGNYQNVANWLADFREYMPVARLRRTMAARYEQRHAFVECQLLHGQVYAYKFHRAKTDVIIGRKDRGEHVRFRPLQDFLEAVPDATPHKLFRDRRARASTQKADFDLSGVRIIPRNNLAVANARIALQAVAKNKLRHEVLQEFMLVNDSVTVAVEVPVFLTRDDIDELRDDSGYAVPFTLGHGACVTGHIDIVQIRNGAIHVLDYKPGAKGVKPIAQLTVYALALSRLTQISLGNFRCAWFDDEHYFEFRPRDLVDKSAARR